MVTLCFSELNIMAGVVQKGDRKWDIFSPELMDKEKFGEWRARVPGQRPVWLGKGIQIIGRHRVQKDKCHIWDNWRNAFGVTRYWTWVYQALIKQKKPSCLTGSADGYAPALAVRIWIVRRLSCWIYSNFQTTLYYYSNPWFRGLCSILIVCLIVELRNQNKIVYTHSLLLIFSSQTQNMYVHASVYFFCIKCSILVYLICSLPLATCINLCTIVAVPSACISISSGSNVYLIADELRAIEITRYNSIRRVKVIQEVQHQQQHHGGRGGKIEPKL